MYFMLYCLFALTMTELVYRIGVRIDFFARLLLWITADYDNACNTKTHWNEITLYFVIFQCIIYTLCTELYYYDWHDIILDNFLFCLCVCVCVWYRGNRGSSVLEAKPYLWTIMIRFSEHWVNGKTIIDVYSSMTVCLFLSITINLNSNKFPLKFL